MRHLVALLGAWLALAGTPGAAGVSLAETLAGEEQARRADATDGGRVRGATDAYDDSVWRIVT